MGKRFYEINVAGCKRKLHVINLNDEIAIASLESDEKVHDEDYLSREQEVY